MVGVVELEYSRRRSQVIVNQVHYGRNWLWLWSKCGLFLSQSNSQPKAKAKSSKLDQSD